MATPPPNVGLSRLIISWKPSNSRLELGTVCLRNVSEIVIMSKLLERDVLSALSFESFNPLMFKWQTFRFLIVFQFIGPGFNSKEPDLNNSNVIINIKRTNIGRVVQVNEHTLFTIFTLLKRPILSL